MSCEEAKLPLENLAADGDAAGRGERHTTPVGTKSVSGQSSSKMTSARAAKPSIDRSSSKKTSVKAAKPRTDKTKKKTSAKAAKPLTDKTRKKTSAKAAKPRTDKTKKKTSTKVTKRPCVETKIEAGAEGCNKKVPKNSADTVKRTASTSKTAGAGEGAGKQTAQTKKRAHSMGEGSKKRAPTKRLHSTGGGGKKKSAVKVVERKTSELTIASNACKRPNQAVSTIALPTSPQLVGLKRYSDPCINSPSDPKRVCPSSTTVDDFASSSDSDDALESALVAGNKHPNVANMPKSRIRLVIPDQPGTSVTAQSARCYTVSSATEKQLLVMLARAFCEFATSVLECAEAHEQFRMDVHGECTFASSGASVNVEIKHLRTLCTAAHSRRTSGDVTGLINAFSLSSESLCEFVQGLPWSIPQMGDASPDAGSSNSERTVQDIVRKIRLTMHDAEQSWLSATAIGDAMILPKPDTPDLKDILSPRFVDGVVAFVEKANSRRQFARNDQRIAVLERDVKTLTQKNRSLTQLVSEVHDVLCKESQREQESKLSDSADVRAVEELRKRQRNDILVDHKPFSGMPPIRSRYPITIRWSGKTGSARGCISAFGVFVPYIGFVIWMVKKIDLVRVPLNAQVEHDIPWQLACNAWPGKELESTKRPVKFCHTNENNAYKVKVASEDYNYLVMNTVQMADVTQLATVSDNPYACALNNDPWVQDLAQYHVFVAYNKNKRASHVRSFLAMMAKNNDGPKLGPFEQQIRNLCFDRDGRRMSQVSRVAIIPGLYIMNLPFCNDSVRPSDDDSDTDYRRTWASSVVSMPGEEERIRAKQSAASRLQNFFNPAT